MYLRFTRRRKDGKEHRYWSIVESKRCAGGRVVQRPVLYLGEINDSQREAWCRVIEALTKAASNSGNWRCFPPIKTFRSTPRLWRAGAARCAWNCTGRGNGEPAGWRVSFMSNLSSTGSGRRACRTRAKGTSWRHILQTLVCYRLIDPGSEWRLHRQWFEQSAMGDLLGEDYCAGGEERALPLPGQAAAHTRRRCSIICAALAGSVRCQVRCAAVRPDQHLLRERLRRTTKTTNVGTATAATSAAIACKS